MRLSLPSGSGQGGLQMKRQGNGYKLYPLRLLLCCSKVATSFFYLPSAATIEPMTAESSSLATAKLFLPASFNDAPTR